MNLTEAKKIILNNILGLKNEDEERIVRITVKIDPVDILAWLKSQDNSFKKIYWRDRASGFACAGIGESVSVKGTEFPGYDHIVKEMTKYLNISPTGVRFYGGISFPSSTPKIKDWEEFGYYYFLLPLFELIRDPTGVYFVCNLKLPLKDAQTVIEQLKKVNIVDEALFSIPVSIKYTERTDIPSLNEWKRNANNIIKEIKNNKFVKVVLARKSTFKLKKSFDVYSFLRDPQWDKEKAYHFLIQLSPSIIFVGMSPERIYFRDNNHIETEAIAGTRSRGKTIEEDNRLAKELKSSVKELQEHRLVSNMLKEKMSSLCISVRLEVEEEILKLSYMQHLYTKFSGKLMNGISDGKIISALYPNPAIAGYPIAESLRKIKEIEMFDRGWYSGPFGWLAHNAVEFIVSIRSALILGDSIHLYSGAGLVYGSDPLDEWKELDNKILNFTKLMKNV